MPLPNPSIMRKEQPQQPVNKPLRWVGSKDQPSHPEALRRLLRELGQMPIEISQTEIEVEVLIRRLERGNHLGSRRQINIQSSPHPKLKELRWKLEFKPGDYALRLYLAVEPSEYLGLRWQIKDLELDSGHMRLTQNLEIALATLAYFENQAENN
jgi:hypothetical protein